MTEDSLSNSSSGGDPVADSPERASSDSSLCNGALTTPSSLHQCGDALSPEAEAEGSSQENAAAEEQALDLKRSSVRSKMKVFI